MLLPHTGRMLLHRPFDVPEALDRLCLSLRIRLGTLEGFECVPMKTVLFILLLMIPTLAHAQCANDGMIIWEVQISQSTANGYQKASLQDCSKPCPAPHPPACVDRESCMARYLWVDTCRKDCTYDVHEMIKFQAQANEDWTQISAECRKAIMSGARP